MISLQNYSTYSIWRGVPQPSQIANHNPDEYEVVALTDKTSLAGVVQFQEAMIEQGRKPLIGMEVNLVNTTDKEKRKNDSKHLGSVLLYVKNEKGWKNLLKIKEFCENKQKGFYYFPRISLEALEEFKDGIICVNPFDGGVGYKVKEGQFEDLSLIIELEDIYKDDFYLGHNLLYKYAEERNEANDMIISLPYKVVPTFNTRFLRRDQFHLFKTLRMMDNSIFSKKNEVVPEFAWMPKREEISHLEYFESLMDQAKELADKCNYLIPVGGTHIPDIDVEESIQGDIKKWLVQGFIEKLAPFLDGKVKTIEQLVKIKPVLKKYYPHEHVVRKGESEETNKTLDLYVDRLLEEFQTIEELEFEWYFYIVQDICKAVDKEGHSRGPARGSAGGALYSFLLDITKVDPVRHDLSFQRFLNKDRVAFPDIDLDFSAQARDYVYKYLKGIHGKNRILPIGTYTRLKAKSGIKAIARAYAYGIRGNDGEIRQYEEKVLNEILDIHVPATARGQEEIDIMLENPRFERFYKTHSDWFESTLLPLIDTVVNASVHACGTVILPEDFIELTPVYWNSSQERFIVEWEDNDVERCGYPKFDLLVVSALDVISDTKMFVKDLYGEDIPQLEDVSLQDYDSLNIFYEGRTDGIFQFGSWLQKNYLPKLKPTSFDDLAASVALLRSGPMEVGAHEIFEGRKNGRLKVEYDHPDLEPILKRTYGLLVYQEQAMAIATKIAGFSGVDADHLRKAIGKKLPEKMILWESKFKEGALERGYDEVLIDSLWNRINAFAQYSFNFAHSVGYSLISYYQAFLKSRYPAEYWAAVLRNGKTSTSGTKQDVYELKYSAQREGVSVVLPNIYAFSEDYKPTKNGEVLWPLRGLKGVGKKTASSITQNGERSSFDSLEHFFDSCYDEDGKSLINSRVVKTLIKADFFEPTGFKPWEVIRLYYKYRQKVSGAKTMEEIPYEFTETSRLYWAKKKNEALGFQVEKWKDVADFSKDCHRFPYDTINEVPDGTGVLVGGIVEYIYKQKTKYGDYYARLKLSDGNESYIVFIWNTAWMNKELDRKRIRPNRGDLFEVYGEKRSFKDRPQIAISDRNAHMRKITT